MQQKKSGFLQSRYEKWEHEEWIPATAPEQENPSNDSKGETAVNEEKTDNASWGLQPFVEKWRQYLSVEENNASDGKQ